MLRPASAIKSATAVLTYSVSLAIRVNAIIKAVTRINSVLHRSVILQTYLRLSYCINNCLWELEAILDLDGFGTGNGKNSTNTATSSILHRGALNIHLENLQPWLPTAQLGMDVSTSIGTSRQGSSAVGTQAEYDLLSRNNGFDDGRAGTGIVLNWDNKPLDSIGIPGRINRLQLAMASVGEGDDGLSSFTDRKDFVAYLGIEPSSQIKNKWISGLKFEMGSWFCNVDNRALANACGRLQIQDLGNGGRQALFDSGVGIGDGLATFFSAGNNLGSRPLYFTRCRRLSAL
jgi:hypothetical protein